jgi:hypothetical protein
MKSVHLGAPRDVKEAVKPLATDERRSLLFEAAKITTDRLKA